MRLPFASLCAGVLLVWASADLGREPHRRIAGALGAVPSFPGAEGFGARTPAGRGGQIIRVTSLADEGHGSLREALDATGPRVVVFEVSGVIRAHTPLVIRRPFVTIAGQTAPVPGISVYGAGVTIRTHDVLLQHVRIRVGDDPRGPPPGVRDAVQILGPEAHDIILDHLSASWAIDELVGTAYPLRDVTISHSVLSEGLHASHHPEGPHSKGVLVGDHSQRVALIGNLFAHNYDRNPALKGDVSAIVVNNVIYNWGNGAATQLWDSRSEPTGRPTLASIVGNVYLRGPDTPRGAVPIKLRRSLQAGTRIYLSDNQWERGGTDPWAIADVRDAPSPDLRASEPPVWTEPLTVRAARDVEVWVLAHAGARPADRDTVDRRVVAEVGSRRGRIIDAPEQVGGLPDLRGARASLTLPSAPHGDPDGNGYTNLEEWLHALAARVEAVPRE